MEAAKSSLKILIPDLNVDNTAATDAGEEGGTAKEAKKHTAGLSADGTATVATVPDNMGSADLSVSMGYMFNSSRGNSDRSRTENQVCNPGK